MNTLAQGEKKKKRCNIKGDGEGEKVCLRNIDDLITSVGWRGDCMQRGGGGGMERGAWWLLGPCGSSGVVITETWCRQHGGSSCEEGGSRPVAGVT